jgi:hypothetical protein
MSRHLPLVAIILQELDKCSAGLLEKNGVVIVVFRGVSTVTLVRNATEVDVFLNCVHY